MANNIVPIKGKAATWPSCLEKEGAYYYVYCAEHTVATYKKASALITLPTSIKLTHGRNAYICLGVLGGTSGSIDIGLRKLCRKDTDQGDGWEAMIYQNPVKTDPPLEENFIHAETAPAGAVRVQMAIIPNLTVKTQITFSVDWLRADNSKIERSGFSKVFNLTRAYEWNCFYRFASLPSLDETATLKDGTFMIGGTFENAYLGSAGNINWGIFSEPTKDAWIVYPSQCSVPYKWDVGEQFRIEHK